MNLIKLKKTERNGSIIAAVAIIALSLLLGLRTINDYPAHIHAWAQGDWYAISLGFQNNGFDLFHPETNIYNKQFPGWWKVDYGNTVTSVDFPIHGYIIALLMKFFGTSAPWVYRGWTLLCSVLGLWFLFLLGRRLTSRTVKSLLVVMLAATSPLFVYYFNNYLVSAPALALVSAGLWAYVKYYQTDKGRSWNLSIAFLTLATMMRTSHAVVLIAVFSFELLRVFRKERPFLKRLPAVVVSLLLIIGYMLWNAHLRNLNGSLFLNELELPRGWDDVVNVHNNVRERWMYRYFSKLQQIIMACIAGLALIGILLRRRGRMRIQPEKLNIGFLLLIWFVGEVAFCVAMMRQFVDHDYYFLDSLFLPVLFLMFLALRQLPQLRRLLAPVGWVALILLAGTMYNNAKHELIKSKAEKDRSVECFANYDESDVWLDEQGVPRDARILSLFSYPQNTPFIQMGRKGYSMMWLDDDIVQQAVSFPYDYIVVEDCKVRELFDIKVCGFMKYMRRISGNGRVSLAVMEDTVVNRTVDDFFYEPDYVQLYNGHFAVNRSEWFPLMLNYRAEFREKDGRLRVVPMKYYGGDDITSHFDTIASWGFNAVRVCLDVMDETLDTAEAYAATRRMVQQAADAGLRVMLLIKPPLDDYWRSYTIGLLKRLADLPALWAYDFMNEPLYFDPVADRPKEDAIMIVREWRDMVRRYAPHQLFTVATAEPIEVFEWDPSMLPVDFIEMHTYHPLRVQSEMWWYSHYCGKPWMVGETGLPADGDSVSYNEQELFMMETYSYARMNGAIGYGWWEFQDCLSGVNFEAQYTGLRDAKGHRKPAASLAASLCSLSLGNDERIMPVNYYNMLAYRNLAITGTVVNEQGHPVEGAVIRGWNDDWSVGVNTYSDGKGRFRLVSNDICTHFEVSAPGCSRVKFDNSNLFPTNLSLPDRHREYQSIPLTGWDLWYYSEPINEGCMPSNKKDFAAGKALSRSLGNVKLKRL